MPPVHATKAGYSLRTSDPDDLNQQLKFLAARGPDAVTITFDVESSIPPYELYRRLNTEIGQFKRTDGVRFYNSNYQILANAITEGQNTVQFHACVDPGRGRRVIPGIYTGTIAINDESLKEPVVISFQIFLKYPDPWGPLVVVAFAGWVASLFYANFLDEHYYDLRTWWTSSDNRKAVFFACGALIAVYSASYLRSDVWGSDLYADIGALFTAAFTAHITALTTYLGIIRNKRQRASGQTGSAHESD